MKRAFLGIQYRGAPRSLIQNEDLPQGSAIVSQVESGSPAAEASLQAGDIVTAIEGAPLENHLELGNRIASMRPGEEVSLRVNRNGESQSITVTLGSRGTVATASASQGSEETPASPEALREELGLELQDVTPEVARHLGLDQSHGVLTTGVDQSNPMIRSSGSESGQIIFRRLCARDEPPTADQRRLRTSCP